MKEESRFNGEYRKTGSNKVTDADMELVKKADERMKALLDAQGGEESPPGPSAEMKNLFDDEGSWITVNGTHINIKPGENVGQAFKRTTGKDMQPGENIGQAFARINKKSNGPSGTTTHDYTPDSSYTKNLKTSGPEIAKTVDKGEYKHYGLRYLSPDPNTGKVPDLNIGDTPPDSYKWNDDNPTNKRLPGTSAVRVTSNTVKNPTWHLNIYGYKGRVVLLGSDSFAAGADTDEIVMRNAKVLDTFERGGDKN